MQLRYARIVFLPLSSELVALVNKIEAYQLPLFKALFEKAEIDLIVDKVAIKPMNDGGMGSHTLSIGKDDSVFGEVASELRFNDSDGVPVLASLNVDQKGYPFEVDLFKADYSKLRKWPSEDELSESN